MHDERLKQTSHCNFSCLPFLFQFYAGNTNRRYTRVRQDVLCFLVPRHDMGASTQVTHLDSHDSSVQHKREVSSRQYGPNHRTSYFSGFDGVAKSANALQDLCNVNTTVFALLLSMLPLSTERKCDVTFENRLLLFLMKLKLGISYSSLAVLFSASVTSASRHFKGDCCCNNKVDFSPPIKCDRGYDAGWVCAHYPACTMIIDCIEVRTEKPATAQHASALFTLQRGEHTEVFKGYNTRICFCSRKLMVADYQMPTLLYILVFLPLCKPETPF